MSIYGFKVKGWNGSDKKIHGFCTSRHGITFPQFSKIGVLGSAAAMKDAAAKVEEVL